MFILQKILSNVIISPGIFIILLILALIHSFKKKNINKTRLSLLIIICATYLLSIVPIKDAILRPLETKYKPITKEQLAEGDCYIILGGGALRDTPNSVNSPNGSPTPNALARVVEGVKLYKLSHKKIIITGGKVYGEKVSEAKIYEQVMVDLGVPKSDIILEENSKTTAQNAKFTRTITSELSSKRPILITSATHMKRAQYIFGKNGIQTIPAPTNYLGSFKESHSIDDYFPNSRNFVAIKTAVWEYIGLIFYRIKN